MKRATPTPHAIQHGAFFLLPGWRFWQRRLDPELVCWLAGVNQSWRGSANAQLRTQGEFGPQLLKLPSQRYVNHNEREQNTRTSWHRTHTAGTNPFTPVTRCRTNSNSSKTAFFRVRSIVWEVRLCTTLVDPNVCQQELGATSHSLRNCVADPIFGIKEIVPIVLSYRPRVFGFYRGSRTGHHIAGCHEGLAMLFVD